MSPKETAWAPILAIRVKGPLGPAVERYTSNPSSLSELSCHERLMWLFDVAMALVPEGGLTNPERVDAPSAPGSSVVAGAQLKRASVAIDDIPNRSAGVNTTVP